MTLPEVFLSPPWPARDDDKRAAAAAAPVGAGGFAAGPEQPVLWPSLRALLKHMHTRPTNVGRLASVTIGFLRSYSRRQQFEALVDCSLVFGGLQRRGAEAYAPLFRAFLDKRFGMGERFDVYGRSVSKVERLLSREAVQTMARGGRVPLVRMDGFVVDLGVNECSMEEGLWSMTLRSEAGHRLSNISFSFLKGDRLLVGSVQGPKMQNDGALADIRLATRALHGMRPPYFVMAVLKSFAHQSGQKLLGIDPQVKARLRRWPWSKAYHFDYRAFWLEHGGRLSDTGYWTLTTRTEVRSPQDVPSKKRAMYARRAEMIESLDAQLRSHLSDPRDAARSSVASAGRSVIESLAHAG